MKSKISSFIIWLSEDGLIVRIAWGIAVFVLIAFVGYVRHRKRMCVCIEKQNFLTDYRNRFIKYLNQPKDREEYAYLTKHLTKAQQYMGSSGIFEKLKLPFENVYHLNVPVLTLLNQIDMNIHNQCGSMAYDFAQMVDNALIRSIGDHEDKAEQIRKRSKNVFIDFYTGFYFLFSSPFKALSYMITGKDYFESSHVLNAIVKVIAGIVQCISVLSGIVTIAVGWDDFVAFILRFVS